MLGKPPTFPYSLGKALPECQLYCPVWVQVDSFNNLQLSHLPYTRKEEKTKVASRNSDSGALFL